MGQPARAALRQRLQQACLQLVQIPSVTGDEVRMADHLEAWCRSQAVFAGEDVRRHGNGLIVGRMPEGRRPCVLLVGHTDTVPPQGGASSAAVDGDKLSGLGASDMKGAIAVMQALVENIPPADLVCDLVLVLYDREEGSYADNGLQVLLDRHGWLGNADLAIVMEPTDNTLQLGCMGSLHARLTFCGRAAHSARPWQGENAIHKAGPLLVALQRRPCLDRDVGGLIFREALSATVAAGGGARNVIPHRFEVNLNYRFAPVPPAEQTVDNAVAELKRIVGDAAEVAIVEVAPPGPVPSDNPLVAHLRTLGGLAVQPKQAWTDVARLAARGVDAVNFGPGMGAQAHQAGEWISIEAMAHAYDVLARFVTTPLSELPAQTATLAT